MGPVCYLDMDGVLCDFTGAALAAHGKSLPPREIQWDFPKQVGFADQYDPAFWAPLGREFWAGLPWTAEGREVLAAAEELFGPERVCLLTAPAPTEGCVEGKLDWVRREVPGYASRVLLGGCKHLLAHPRAVLVDDRNENALQFVRAGGWSLLVPRPWNVRGPAVDGQGRFDPSALRGELAYLRDVAGR